MKTCKETKSFLHFWLGVWMLEEETFISYMYMRWCSKAQIFGCRHTALLAVLVFSKKQWVVAPESWRSLQRLKIQISEVWKDAATRASLNPPMEVRYQFRGSPLPSLSPSPACKPGWLCTSRTTGIWLVVSEYCSQQRDGCSLPSIASASWVTGPALPQVAKPEPLVIICCYTGKNRGQFRADRGWWEKVLLLPSS